MNILILHTHATDTASWDTLSTETPVIKKQAVSSLEEGLTALSENRYDFVFAGADMLADRRLQAVYRKTQSPACQLVLSLSETDALPVELLASGVDGCISGVSSASVLPFLTEWRRQENEMLNYRSELRERDEEIATLVAISNIVTSNLEFIPLLAAIAEKTSRTLDADRTTIFMYDAAGAKLDAAFAEGLGPYSISIPATHGIAGYVATEQRMVNVVNAYQDPRFYNEIDHGTGYITRTVLCAPMLSPIGKLIGVIQCLNKRSGAFNAEDERILSMLAPLYAIAVENALLYRDLQEEVRHNEAIMEEKIQAERLAIVGKMARSVTRDIAGPMEDIVHHAVRLSQEDINVAERDATSRAIEGIVDDLVGLAQELLDFSRERIELIRSAYSLIELAGMIRLHLGSGLPIHADSHDSESPSITIDIEKLTHALGCVWGALRHFDTEDTHLTVDLNPTGLYFTLNPVSHAALDTIMALLIDPFTGADEDHTAGLKLAVAKRVIDAHQGSISRQDGGLCIYIPQH